MKRMFGQPCLLDLACWLFTGKMITVDEQEWRERIENGEKTEAETETDPFAF